MITKFRRKTTALVAVLAVSALAIAPTAAQAQAQPRQISVPIIGTVVGGGTFAGTLALTRFARRGDQVVALGTLTGVLTNAAGVATSVIAPVALPTAVTAAACQILHLDIGPIALDLLGLQVNLSQVILDITAQSGAGNLLGNLLCAVAGLLDSPGGLARLLNQILGILAGA